MPIGLAVTLAGYTLIYFGVSSLRGPGVGLLDLIVPGRYHGPPQTTTAGAAVSSPAPKTAKAAPTPSSSPAFV